jgi:hypothetical protein
MQDQAIRKENAAKRPYEPLQPDAFGDVTVITGAVGMSRTSF